MIQLRPTYHLVSELLSISHLYALKEHEDYFQDLKDPRVVQCYHEIQLRPTYHLVSELLSISRSYALKGHEDYCLNLKDPRVVQSYPSDPVKAHLPSAVSATEFIAPVCPERTRGLLPGFERSQSRAVLSIRSS